MLRIEANPAPTNDPIVEPKLFMDIKSANKVPSIPGGQSCPDRMRNGINLQIKNGKIRILDDFVSFLSSNI